MINATLVDALLTVILSGYSLGIQTSLKIRKFLIECIFYPIRSQNNRGYCKNLPIVL